MATFLIALFSVVLVLTCLFVTLLVLMQKPSANSGMGAALGGGAAEQAFGGEATNVLTRGTIYAIIAFFVLSFSLYLGTLASAGVNKGSGEGASITKLEGDQPLGAAGAEGGEGSAESDAAASAAEDSNQGETSGARDASKAPADSVDEMTPATEQAPLQLEDLDRPQETAGS